MYSHFVRNRATNVRSKTELGADISDLATSLTYLSWLMHQIWIGDSMDPAYSLEVMLCVSCCNTGKGEFSSEKQKQVAQHLSV